MLGVLRPLARDRGTCVYPFQPGKLGAALAGGRVVVEACPASTLKVMKLPHQNYKQPAGGPLSAKRLRVRRAILAGLEPWVEIPPPLRRRIMRNGGGDALDAVIAAVGAYRHWGELAAGGRLADIARHKRFGREGYTFA